LYTFLATTSDNVYYVNFLEHKSIHYNIFFLVFVWFCIHRGSTDAANLICGPYGGFLEID
jgi:hypothetical protein